MALGLVFALEARFFYVAELGVLVLLREKVGQKILVFKRLLFLLVVFLLNPPVAPIAASGLLRELEVGRLRVLRVSHLISSSRLSNN